MRAQENLPFQLPPPPILALADVDLPPATLVDRNGRYLIHLKRPAYKTLSELAEPELRLAGLRINPRNHDRSRTSYMLGIEIQEIATGKRTPVTGLPDPVRIEYPRFSPKSTYLSFVVVEPDGLALWVVEMASSEAHRVTPLRLSAVLDTPYQWLPDESGIYCHIRSANPPAEHTELPAGPTVQEAAGRKAPGRTYQDLLRNQADERKFDSYATTEVHRFTLAGQSQKVLEAGIYRNVTVSPDGNYLLVEAIRRPYSYQFPLSRFPYRVTVTDGNGHSVAELADKPLQDDIPIAFDATERGRRNFQWRNDRAATVCWIEALDDGDPAREVPRRDRIYQLPGPFDGEPSSFCATRHRFQRMACAENGLAVVTDFLWKNRSVTVYLVPMDQENADPRVIFEYSSEDLYRLPGTFITVPNDAGRDVLLTNADRSRFYLEGEGYSPEGNRPFLDEFDIASGQTERLWRAEGKTHYENIVRLLDGEKRLLLTRIQSATQFPNYYLRQIGGTDTPRQLTTFENPFAALQGVTKQKIHYQREDGVALSADLLLPPGYDPERDGRLPLLMEAYPTEFKNKDAAGMVDSSPHQFVYPSWGSPVFWVVRGYAVLENAQFPVVGEGDQEPNDTYIQQLVGNARAAIQAVDRMGVADRRSRGRDGTLLRRFHDG